jgi:hypothetical protein
MFNNFSKDSPNFFIGTVVEMDYQKEQVVQGIGWGWRYKIAIQGDYTNNNSDILPEKIGYGICLLPTTAGSGGAGRRTPVLISQGDKVFGIKLGGVDGIPIILGTFPRTTDIELGTKIHDCKSGYGGNLKRTSLLIEETNESCKGNTLQCSKGGANKSNRALPS